MKSVTLRGVSRHFGRHVALHRTDLELHAGSLTGIVGANGAGKTTLMNMIATLDRPSSGTIHYDSWPWRHMSRRGRELVGWVSHAPLVYGDLTGAENLRFYASMYGVPEASERAGALLGRVGLLHAADKLVNAYSRGMVQRLTIARALLHDPHLLLLDEPLTGLDRQGRRDVLDLFEEQRAQGRILLLSTHDLHALQRACTRLLVMRQGSIVLDHEVEGSEDMIAIYEAHA